MLRNLFRITDKKIFRKLGNEIYIRNGVGYGFISTEELYHNGHLEIGIGEIRSGYGDWGGGATHSYTSPLFLVIDKDYNIISTKTDSFYNAGKSAKQLEQVAEKLISRLGKKFIVESELLRTCLDKIFGALPIKSHIGLTVKLNDPEHTINMLDFYIKEENYPNIEDSKYKNK